MWCWNLLEKGGEVPRTENVKVRGQQMPSPCDAYRGTSLIRKRPPPEDYRTALGIGQL